MSLLVPNYWYNWTDHIISFILVFELSSVWNSDVCKYTLEKIGSKDTTDNFIIVFLINSEKQNYRMFLKNTFLKYVNQLIMFAIMKYKYYKLNQKSWNPIFILRFTLILHTYFHVSNWPAVQHNTFGHISHAVKKL